MAERFIAVNIGCMECGEESSLIGVFHTREIAEREAASWSSPPDGGTWGRNEWHGQHTWEVFGESQAAITPKPAQPPEVQA